MCLCLSSGDPFVHRLAGKCSWTLRMPGNSSSGSEVALLSDSTDLLVKQICQDLDCGAVYHVDKTRSPPNTTCFHDCLYQDGRLQNCSQSVGSNCAVIAEAVCGEIVSFMLCTFFFYKLANCAQNGNCEEFEPVQPLQKKHSFYIFLKF